GGPLRGPATYRVRVTRSGFELEPRSAFASLVVPERGTPLPLLLVVKVQDKELTGTVVDGSGGPVRDARVIVTRPERHSDTLATTSTSNDGSFVVRGLGAGPYAVKALAPSGSEAEAKPIALPAGLVRLVLPEVGTIQGALSGFTKTPTIMAWSVAGYDWDFHPATIAGGRFVIQGLSRGRYHVAASTPEAAAQATVEVKGAEIVELDLVASSQRTIRAKILDFVTGKPLPGMRCQAAPDLGDTRSPVVVPGVTFSNEAGEITLADVPASPLYMWCSGEGAYRGGVARMPAELGEKIVTVWGLDARGKPSLDVRALGLTMADDHPFSRRVTAVDPRGAADRAGIQPGDVFEKIGERSVEACGNGIVRNYLALVLTDRRSIPVTLSRGGAAVPVVFALE
ncbi:MAG: carboxypeptidase regulatory-like domain-containing protein, partial [Labilithrix sp.]|nr:carboxypeptidase regulatory-like domain-containing protein [Labilithrix sp.]